MSGAQVNGGCLHTDRAAGAPDATTCWLEAVKTRREFLQTTVAAGRTASQTLVEFNVERQTLEQIARELVKSEDQALELAKNRLGDYDDDSELQLAETGGRVRSVRAQLEHRRNQRRSGDASVKDAELEGLAEELSLVEKADGQALARRLKGREPIRQEWVAAARARLIAGLQLLTVVDPDRPRLANDAMRANAAIDELAALDHLNTLANPETKA